MPQRKRKTPVPSGMSAKQMKRRKPIGIDHLKTIEPLTTNQEKVFKSYAKGKHLVLHGAAGTGKTFISLYLALQQVLDEGNPYEKVYMVLLYLQERLVSYQVITKTSQIYIRYHTKIWSDICLKCLQITTLKCYMIT